MTVVAPRVLGDRYALGDVVGTGGMADVYRAQDRVLDREVAIKLLRPSSARDDERARFTTEARTLAGLSHPGLVTLLDAGILDEHPYLVMELIEGPSLAAEIRATGGLDPERVAALGAQVADALAYAHDVGVVHRDVKPGNILIAAEDRAMLADFGIARLLAEDSGHTRTGDTIGSPAYLSPEQVNGEPLTAAVDVYSLGLVLLEALTGNRAYAGTPVEAAVARLTAAPAIPTSLDASWRDLLIAMTRREPHERPTAAEVAGILGSARAVALTPRSPDALTATGPLDLGPETAAQTGTDPGESTVVGLPLPRNPRRGSGVLWIASAALLLGLLAGFLVLGGLTADAGSGQPTIDVPAGVPAPYAEPLSALHDAVNGTQP